MARSREAAAATLGSSVAPLTLHRTVEQILARELRKLILDGRLRPGERLRYRDLAQQFDVSVTPVRIALRELSIEGLVEMRAHEGARVSRLSLEDLEEVYATRIGLECWLARRGVKHLDAAAFRRMDRLLADSQQAVKDNDRPRFLESAWGHRTVCYEAADRPRLLAIASGLYGRSGRYHTLTLDVPRRLKESMAFLRDFDRACRARNGPEAAAVVEATLTRAAEYIIENFPSFDGSAE